MGKKKLRLNRSFPEHNSASGDYSGKTLSPKVIAIIAEAMGMPGKTMAQIAKGESGNRPGATGIDPGGTKGLGLFMVTTGYNDELIAKYGGQKAMLNPIKNAKAAAEIYKSQGLGAWYGDQYVTDPNAHLPGGRAAARAKLRKLKGKGKLPKGSGAVAAKGTPKKTTRKLIAPAQNLSSERMAAKLAFIQDEDKTAADYVGITQQLKSLRNVPAQYATTTTPRQPRPKGATKKDVIQDVPGGKKGGTTKTGSKAPKSIVQIGKIAQKMGLSVGENPKFGGVAPVHVSGSYHYQGRAIDVSGGSAELMSKFANKISRKYGKHLAELFWNGTNPANIDNGTAVGVGYVSGHTDHVHVAV